MVAQLSSSTPTLLTDDTPHYDTASDLTVPLTLPANAAAPKNSDDQLATNERSKEDYPEERQASGEDEEKHEYPRVSEQYLMTMALCLSVFSISLGHTMISTAIPEITDQFNSLGDIGWYGSAYSLTTGTFLPVFGRLYKVGSVKWIFLFAIFIFELGSLACGLARISRILIFGRALVGLGSAGISSGTLPIISHYVPVRQRFTHTTIMTAASGIAFLVGPLIGGAFTVHISWRWCFFINLPLGLLELLTELPKKMKTNRGSLRLFVHWFMKLERFGLFATFIDIPGIVCLLLALSWGGTTYTWSDWRIILLFVLYAILIMTSIAMQAWRKEYAISPFALGQRSIYAGLGFAFCMSAAFSIINYYMPIWFQAVKGASPTNSGVMSLPLVISVPVLSIMVRSAIMHVGYYMPFMIASSIFMSAGAGLLTTLRPNTGQEAWIGYLVLFGTGVGLGMQLSVIAVQTVLLLTVPSEGEVLIMSARHLGDAIFISIGQNIFENRLVSNLRSMQPDVNAPQIGSFGTTTMRNLFPAESLPKVLTAYNSAINQALYTAVGIAALSTIGSLLMKPTLSRTQLDEMKVTSVDMNEYKVAMRRSRRAEPCDTSRDLSSSRPSLTPLIST
ncbi:MFS transporter [Viridothelium virens]|uniref:MFS transporter n=1 Tax=Viridothelium virens TaxID=1048519 RepID=A0A6A6H184_VIRVR|nr:MFS transporter [Viridothelium virens]